VSTKDAGVHQALIKQETQDWGKGSIIDFIAVNASDNKCPVGYEKVQAHFPGIV